MAIVGQDASRRVHGLPVALVLGAGLLGTAAVAAAEMQSRDDAWWTGPMLAPSAATLPTGHALIEPYLFDVVSTGAFDAQGKHQPGGRDQTIGSLTYMLYGLTDRVTVGMIPRFFYSDPAGAPSSSGVAPGDLTLQAGYGLTQYHDGSAVPAIALVIDETLPTGRYQNLSRQSDGQGGGAYATALSVYLQEYFWMPNGRILRGRLDLTYTRSSSVGLENQTVYGTAYGFRGRAWPGAGFTGDAAAEYSLTRRWVLALDVVYQYNFNTRVQRSSEDATVPLHSDTGSGWSLGFAPALEYNWSARAGVLLGVRVIGIGRNVGTSVTPAIAVNLVI